MEFKRSCVNNSYISGLLLKRYIMNALGLILGQKQTFTQIINKVGESCLNSGWHV